MPFAGWWTMLIRAFPLALLAAGCSQSEDRLPANMATETPVAEAEEYAATPPAPATETPIAERPSPAPLQVVARERILGQWAKAANRTRCAPIGFNNVGGRTADSRPAAFSGGWGVAFDTDQVRSLYGVAGTDAPFKGFDAEVDRILVLWPYDREIGGKAGRLPARSMAGYGIEGASRYPSDNAGGNGMKSLAYVVIPGQDCLYNVWSSVSRAHLETLLDGLTIIERD